MYMRTLFIIFLIFCVNSSYSQDTVRINHTNYTTVFSTVKKYPVLVEWWITRAKIDCKTPLKRKDNFKPDPKLPTETDIAKDYVGSGKDRGHMMPAADNGDWKSLEVYVRETARIKDSIMVWCGNFGEIKKIGKVSVPKYCWKVIFIKKENLWSAFLFENTTSKPDGFKNNEVSLEKISNLTGFKFR